ncbi:MAG: hypothetical protein ACRD26_19445 [Vicinamibacterales bacterium]
MIAVVLYVAAWRRHRQAADLGTLSDHWMAEQRLGRGPDAR